MNWDWRDKNAVQVVKDQGLCSSGYAFAAIGGEESAFFIKNGVLYNLSEQNIIDCDHYGAGCDGGFADGAYAYVVESQGGYFSTEADYPYTGQVGSCNFVKGPANLIGYDYVSGGDERNLMMAVYDLGPIACSINAEAASFQLYTSGIYDNPDCSFWLTSHSVLTVGYGTDSSAKDYWIVKNSWGTEWGQKGYIWMSRNKNNQCGIATMGVVPTFE